MTRYRANTPRFVDETVDGEALIMDMVTGSYYTCLDASTVAWEALKDGLETDEVAAILAASYGVDDAAVVADVERFAGELVQEAMLVERGDAPQAAPRAPAAARNGAPVADYEPLRFERYTDLADLILLDPVHDVSEAGWPHEPA